MYSELIIRPKALSDTIMHPDTARKLVAEALDGTAVPKLIFNRREDGMTISDRYICKDKSHITSGMPLPPVVSYDGGKGFIRIYMLGEQGRKLMEEVAPVIASAVAKQVGGPYSFDLNEGMCTIKEKHTPILYSTRRIVVAKEIEEGNLFRDKEPQEVSDKLRRIIIRGLLAQARWLDENSDGKCNLEGLIPHEDSIGFHIADGKQVPIVIKDKNHAWGYANLTFTLNLDLMGPWQAGRLLSHGHGRIRKVILKGQHD